MKEGKSGGFIHMGTISLLTVLLVVMLVVLSLLMLSGARQDYDYSQKLAQRKTEFYEANNQVQRIRQQVLMRLEEPSPELGDLPVTWQDDQITWQVPLGDSQVLRAAMTFRDGQWMITCWQVE